MSNCLANVLSAISMLLCGYYGTTRTTAIALVSLSVGVTGILNSAGYVPNMIDLSPKYAGILMGITNTVGTLPGMIGPLIVEAIVSDVRWRERERERERE